MNGPRWPPPPGAAGEPSAGQGNPQPAYATGYTRYRNVYGADGPLWPQSARQ